MRSRVYKSPYLKGGRADVVISMSRAPEPLHFAKGGLARKADLVRRAGRGDDILLHLNKVEFDALRKEWGEPAVNPKTGLPEYSWYGDLWNTVSDYFTNDSGSHPITSTLADAALGAGVSKLSGNSATTGALVGGGLGLASQFFNDKSMTGSLLDATSKMDTEQKLKAAALAAGVIGSLHKPSNNPPSNYASSQDPNFSKGLTPISYDRTPTPTMDPTSFWTYGQTSSPNPGEHAFFNGLAKYTPFNTDKPPVGKAAGGLTRAYADGGSISDPNYLSSRFGRIDPSTLFGGALGSVTDPNAGNNTGGYTGPPVLQPVMKDTPYTVAPPGTSGTGVIPTSGGSGGGGGLSSVTDAISLAKAGSKLYDKVTGAPDKNTPSTDSPSQLTYSDYAPIAGPAAGALAQAAEAQGTALTPDIQISDVPSSGTMPDGTPIQDVQAGPEQHPLQQETDGSTVQNEFKPSVQTAPSNAGLGALAGGVGGGALSALGTTAASVPWSIGIQEALADGTWGALSNVGSSALGAGVGSTAASQAANLAIADQFAPAAADAASGTAAAGGAAWGAWAGPLAMAAAMAISNNTQAHNDSIAQVGSKGSVVPIPGSGQSAALYGNVALGAGNDRSEGSGQYYIKNPSTGALTWAGRDGSDLMSLVGRTMAGSDITGPINPDAAGYIADYLLDPQSKASFDAAQAKLGDKQMLAKDTGMSSKQASQWTQDNYGGVKQWQNAGIPDQLGFAVAPITSFLNNPDLITRLQTFWQQQGGEQGTGSNFRDFFANTLAAGSSVLGNVK